MTFFYYFTYSKLFLGREIDKLQMVVVCVYLSCITTNHFISIEDLLAEYNRILKISGIFQPPGSITKQINEIFKLEFELLNFLGFDVGIATPYSYVDECCLALDLFSMPKAKELINCSLNIINDSYRSDLSVYYTPKNITLSSFYIAVKIFSDEEEFISKNVVQFKYECEKNCQRNEQSELILCIKDLFSILEACIGYGGYEI